MSQTIKLKRTAVAGRSYADAGLVSGEMCMNSTDEKLWVAFDTVKEVITQNNVLTAVTSSNKLVTESDIQSLAGGDMLKTTYDTNLSGVVDDSEDSQKLGGELPSYYLTSSNINYDNNDADLMSVNVKGALDELSLSKADVSLLSSNIVLYPTTVESDVTGYFRQVSSTGDSDYNSTAVDVGTGTISSSAQLIASLISDANQFTGNPGIVNITTIGNIAKTAGNSQQYAEFYFEIYRRESTGTETLLATSSTTGAVNPVDSNYYQFSASTQLNDGDWVSTDRVVIKYYANMLGNTGSEYNFQFGGASPVRTQLPVPVSVIPSDLAEDILIDTTNFNGILSGADTNVQHALETIDDHNHDADYVNVTGDTMTGALTLAADPTEDLQAATKQYVDNFDPVTTFTKSITLTTDWQDTGIKYTDLGTGTYILQLYANDTSAGGSNMNEYYSGIMSWYAGDTNTSQELPSDEIQLHRAGGSSDAGLYLRTYRTADLDGDNLKLQIYSNYSNASASNYVFKFRKFI
jgi:hypothetical protein